MLYTRCPNCRTTFRITLEILLQADGQVCCGRCETTFSVCERLADRPAQQIPKYVERHASTVETQAPPPALPISNRAPARPVRATQDEPTEAHQTAVPKRSRRRTWITAAALIVVVFAGYQFRDKFITVPGFGPLLQLTDALLRRPIAGTGRLDSYDLLDWSVAAASDELQSDLLEVSLQFTNRGSEPQLYPYVQLELTDSDGERLSLHTFEPEQYLSPSQASEPMLQPGRTVDVKLHLEDPGPQAYGFELDLCLPGASGGFVCLTDDTNE